MSDSKQSLQDLKLVVKDFCERRDWDQYHGPKDLAIGLVIESSELLEHFRFRDDQQCLERLEEDTSAEEIRDELADILFFLLRFAQMNEIDLSGALEAKLLKNARNYPVEKAKGTNTKYTEL